MENKDLVITLRAAGSEIVHRLDRRKAGRVIVEFESDKLHISFEEGRSSQQVSEVHSAHEKKGVVDNRVRSPYTGSAVLARGFSRHHQKQDEPCPLNDICPQRLDLHVDKL